MKKTNGTPAQSELASRVPLGKVTQNFQSLKISEESVGSGKAPSFLAGSGGGGSSGPIKFSDHHAQDGAEFPPVATWDFNWDKRQPEAVVKPPPTVPDGQQVEEYHEKIAKATPSAARVLILVRHGQYNLSGSQDSERYLTELGREQADLTGQRLAQVWPLTQFFPVSFW